MSKRATSVDIRFLAWASLLRGVLLLALVFSATHPVVAQPSSTRPNILLIVSDDQRYDALKEYMPTVQSRIFEQGVSFARAYTTTPSCAPSRASILTGRYAHAHGVKTNDDPLNHATIVEHLRASGYYTGLVGKYLNAWNGSPRPEYDFWISFPHGSSRYGTPILNVQGERGRVPGYITDIFGSYAAQFVAAAQAQQKPFFLLFAPNAPHDPATPAASDEGLYSDLPPYRPPSFRLRGESRRDRQREIESIDRFRLNQLRTLESLDRAIAHLLDTLAMSGLLDSTAIFYLSDNGLMWGEHGHREKDVIFEESVHIPFAVRYPPLMPQARERSELVANIDIAPTILDLAGVTVPWGVDGTSLVPLMSDASVAWRDTLFLEGFTRRTFKHPFRAVRTDRYVLEWQRRGAQLYDLAVDPFQLRNRYRDPEYREIRRDLEQELGRYTEADP